jgi:transposase
MKTYYIGADVHCNTTDIAIEYRRQIIERVTVPTTITAIRQVLEKFPGKKFFALEESTLAGWVYRHLHPHVDQLIVSDPRRNHLIARDGDKDDPIDAGKLAQLLRGKYLRAVHHSRDDRRIALKQWVNLYHQRLAQRTAQINRIRAQARAYGREIPNEFFQYPPQKQTWLREQKLPHLAEQLQLLRIGLDAADQQVQLADKQLRKFCRCDPLIKQWMQLPEIAHIRALTIFAYLDTPFRFPSKSRLWKYCGIGLERQTSGTDKKGRSKPARLKMPWRRNGRLKNAILGAATGMIRTNNPFAHHYERMIQHGIKPSNARHTIARKLITVMWTMWKNQTPYDPRRI